jgi:murein DD-endopeptidase MepM/ murein hydrolase activator NlpD
MKSFITEQKIDKRVTRGNEGLGAQPLFVASLNEEGLLGKRKGKEKPRKRASSERTILYSNSKVQRRRKKKKNDSSSFLLSKPIHLPSLPDLKAINMPIIKDRLSIYTLGLFFIILILLFLNSSVPSSGMVRQGEAISIPSSASMEDLLYESLALETSILEEEELKLPAGRVLRSMDTRVHRIKEGDTVSEIAAKYNVSVGTILSFNSIKDVRKIMVGTELGIPSIDGVLYKVKRGDTLSGISASHNIAMNDILDANDLQSEVIRVNQELFLPGGTLSTFELKKATGELFVYPTAGRLSSGFGIRPDPFTGIPRMHYGIDLANYVGTAVKASYEGTVVALGVNQSYGKYVIIKHAGGFQTLYGHLSKWIVSKGEYVGQGEKIGEMGNTGRSTGPHLHFGIYKYQKPVDPLKYLF